MRIGHNPVTGNDVGIAYHLDGDLLRFVTTGGAEYAAGAVVLRRGFAAAAGGPRRHLLFDIRASDEDRSPDELRGVADLVATHRDVHTGRCAMVAADPLHYGLARMAAVFFETHGFEAAVFRDLDAAEAWLRGR